MIEDHIINRFLKFEEENNLFNLKVGELNIWPYFRFRIYSQLIRKKNNLNPSHAPQSIYKEIERFINSFNPYNIVYHNPFLPLKKVDFLLFNHPRRIFVDNVWEEPYTDRFLLKNFSKKFYVFERDFYGAHKKNILVNKNRKFLDLLNSLSVTFGKIKSKMNPLQTDEVKNIDYLQNLINRTFNSTITLDGIKNRIFYIKFYKKLLRVIIRQTKPKRIYEVVYYSIPNLLLNEIASEFGIPTYEFQHGTMGRYHIAYNFLRKKKYTWFPDYILFFNEFWIDNTRLPIEDKYKIIYGNPYLETMKNKYSNNKIYRNEKYTFLFLSQGPIGEELVKLAFDLSKQLNSKNYEILFKLHPSECNNWEKKYPLLLNSTIKVIQSNKEKHLYELFYYSDIQVGVSSTAIFEGLEFGLKTFILKKTGWEYMEELINSGKAILVQNSEDILDYF